MKKLPLYRIPPVLFIVTLMLFTWIFIIQPDASYAAPFAEPHTAYIAVQFGPGHQELRQISFSAPISGLLALQKSGYPVETVDFGGGFVAVCSINGVGCPASNCFCNPDRFWNYEYWDGSQWTGYAVGAVASSIGDGAIEGWRWAEWGVGALPPAPQLLGASKALDWLAGQQSEINGGYGAPAANVESLLAIGANGLSADQWHRSSAAPSLLNPIQSEITAYSKNGAANAGKLGVALAAGGNCVPYSTLLPQDYYQLNSGWYAADAGVHAWAMLGASALSETLPISAGLYLKSLQQSDGGWEWTPGGFGGGTDTNTTALAIQALAAAGEPLTSTTIVKALDYLHLAQNDDGGFPYDADSPYGTDSDANSSAYVGQALLAAGQDINAWAPDGKSLIDYLLSLQLADGSLEWQKGLGANLLATQQAIPALLGRAYPLVVRPVAACPTIFLPLINQ